MQIVNDARVDKEIRSLLEKENSRIVHVLDLFTEHGFSLSALFLKKLGANLWELRAGKWRLLFGKVQQEIFIVHIFRKSTQKTPKMEIDKAQSRLEMYRNEKESV